MSTIYQDPLIEITDQDIVFHHYYFPFGQDRRVPFADIASIGAESDETRPCIAQVAIRPPSFFGGSWRIWGTGNFRTWFPCDFGRPFRDRIFIASLRNSVRRIGFTVEDSQKVTSILRAKGLLQETPSA
jgi:hypothetical protein